jgi:hypothetical protein
MWTIASKISAENGGNGVMKAPTQNARLRPTVQEMNALTPGYLRQAAGACF